MVLRLKTRESRSLPGLPRSEGQSKDEVEISSRRCSKKSRPAHTGRLFAVQVRYVQEGHTQRVIVDGPIRPLRGLIDHDDRKPHVRWLASQQSYARLEADHLLATPREQLRRIDRLRLMAWPAPFLVPAYTLIGKRCLFDGWPGWLYVLQRTLAEVMLALEIVDRRLRPAKQSS